MHASLRPLRAAFASAALGLCPSLVAAQSALSSHGTSAATFLARYHEVEQLAPVSQMASVSHLVLTRDAARLTLERGTLWLLSPIGGRTVGAVFRGEGRFAFAPPLAAEREELRRFADTTALDVPITEAVFLFTDSTLEQLRGLAFGPGDVPGAVGGHAQDLVASLKGDKEGAFEGSVMGPLLNGESTGFFLARIERAHGDPLLFQVDPASGDGVQLFRPVGHIRWGTNWRVVAEFAPSPPLRGRARHGGSAIASACRRTGWTCASRRADATLSSWRARALTLRAEERLGPWLRFGLAGKIDVDSARWGSGEPAPFFKADDDDDLWIRAPRRSRRGTPSLSPCTTTAPPSSTGSATSST